MKNKMDQLLNGEFEYEEPQLLFSSERIAVTLDAGETMRGEVYLGTDQDIKIRGYVTSSSRRFVPGADEFSGTTICLPYGIDAKGMNPGETVKGWVCFTTNIGERKLPFEIYVRKARVQSSEGEVKSPGEFRRIAERDFREAFHLFTRDTFAAALEQSTVKEKALYAGLSRQPVTYQHLEEFLVAAGQKDPVTLTLKKTEAEYYEVRESLQESFTIQRSGWGHIRLELEAYGDFLELPRHVITNEDFIGSQYQVSYVIRREKLTQGCHYGKIIIRSPYEEKIFRVVASKGREVSVHVNFEEKKHRASLVKDYLSYRTGKMDFQTWAASAHYAINELSEAGYDYPEYQMFHAFLLHLEERDEEAMKILEAYQNKNFQKEDVEFAGVYLYLCTLTGLYQDIEQAIMRVRSFYKQRENSFILLYVLLRMDQEYRQSPSHAVFMLEEQFEKGCRSPILYLEAWKYVNDDMSLLHRLSSFWNQVFLFAAKRELLTEELVHRLAYLSGYEKNYEACLYQALAAGYEAYPSKEILESICKYIMQGNPRKPEYFKWYSLAVEQGLRLTRLYEYYIETMDASYRQPLPKSLLVYFSYNTNTLGDSKKALLYANILTYSKQDPMVYVSYRERIRKFAEAKLFEGKMGEHYAVLYQEYFEEPDNAMDAELIAKKMFTHRLYCDDKKIRQVVIRHVQMEKEEVYPLNHGVAYPRIYTKDAVILFQDDKQRRYVNTVAYSIQPLMDEREMIEAVLDYQVNEPGVLLHYCEENEINSENMDIFLRLVKVEGMSEAYRRNVRKQILSYYHQHRDQAELDDGLKTLDYRVYAEVNKKVLLELLIDRGMFQEAMGILEEFGCEGTSAESLLKLTSRIIGRNEDSDEAEVLALASQVYAEGAFDEVTLRYLMERRFGPIDDLLSIWKNARKLNLDTYELEEKILQLFMFTSDYRKEGELLLEHYMKQTGKEEIISTYLTQVAYGCFVKEYSISPFIRQCLEQAYRKNWPVHRISHYTLLKALTREKDPDGKYEEMKKELFEECMEERHLFAFYKKLPAELLSPYQLDDKTFVEIHASPEAKVSISYAMDTGLGMEGIYRTEPIKESYEGIFTKAFTLFYGETLRYSFIIEENGKSKKTPERVLTMNHTNGTSRSKYQMINRILAARRLEKDKEVIVNLKQYLRQEEYVNYMFRLEEEE